MNKNFQLISIIILMMSFSACRDKVAETDAKTLTVSILPQKYFIEALVGNAYNINVMVAAGASPASYEPTPRQMVGLSKSELYLMIGHLAFEEVWIPRIERINPNLKIVDLSSGIELIGGDDEEITKHKHAIEDNHHHHGIDPHIWMSPKHVKTIVENISTALISLDKPSKDAILQKRDSMLIVLDQLDKMFENSLSSIQIRKFIIFHPALTYLAEDYQLEQIAMEFEGKEPSPSYFKSIVDRARSEKIGVLFIQKEFDMENARQLAREVDAELIQIDPLAEDWYSQMIEILDKLKKLDKHAA